VVFFWIPDSFKNLLDGCLQGQLDLDDFSFGIGFFDIAINQLLPQNYNG
jgi:hypothetical protein